jgi:hypothetical protein
VLPNKILRFIILKGYLFDESPDQTTERGRPTFFLQPLLAYRPLHTILPYVASLFSTGR